MVNQTSKIVFVLAMLNYILYHVTCCHYVSLCPVIKENTYSYLINKKWLQVLLFFPGDLAAVVPVAVATLTPFPLLAALVYYNIKNRLCPAEPKEKEMVDMKQDKEVIASLVNAKEDNNQNMRSESSMKLIINEDIIKAWSENLEHNEITWNYLQLGLQGVGFICISHHQGKPCVFNVGLHNLLTFTQISMILQFIHHSNQYLLVIDFIAAESSI